jgi:quercetin dioxygenase-like cupin family protein
LRVYPAAALPIVWTVNGKTFERRAGDIFVIKASEIHREEAAG